VQNRKAETFSGETTKLVLRLSLLCQYKLEEFLNLR
jgi:hypothetical protein